MAEWEITGGPDSEHFTLVKTTCIKFVFKSFYLFFSLSVSLFLSWNYFEDKYVCWLLMKSDARKNKDPIFGAFHKLNLEDAKTYVTEVRAKLLI